MRESCGYPLRDNIAADCARLGGSQPAKAGKTAPDPVLSSLAFESKVRERATLLRRALHESKSQSDNQRLLGSTPAVRCGFLVAYLQFVNDLLYVRHRRRDLFYFRTPRL